MHSLVMRYSVVTSSARIGVERRAKKSGEASARNRIIVVERRDGEVYKVKISWIETWYLRT